MIKKERAKGMIVGIVITLILVSTAGVFASGQVNKNIKVLYNNIKLVIDGKPVAFGKDSVGKDIEPFIHNGTTYLPVRAVGEALGKNVDWDGATQTVYLGEKPGKTRYLTEEIDPFDYSNVDIFKLNNPEKIEIAGYEFNTGYGKYDWEPSVLRFNLNSQYKQLTFKYGPYKSFKDEPGVMNIYLDDNLHKRYVIDQNDDIKNEVIDISGVNQLRIELEYSSGKTFIGIGDAIIK